MTSFYGNQGGGANGLGVDDRFPWQGPVGPSGSVQGIPNLGALSQQANTPNIFQEQLSNPSRGLADVDGIQNALQQFQSQPKTVMASDMDDTEFKFRNLAAKYAAQDNSKPQQSSTGEDNGVSYKTRDEDHATGPDAWASLGKFMKTAGEKQAVNPFQLLNLAGKYVGQRIAKPATKATLKTLNKNDWNPAYAGAEATGQVLSRIGQTTPALSKVRQAGDVLVRNPKSAGNMAKPIGTAATAGVGYQLGRHDHPSAIGNTLLEAGVSPTAQPQYSRTISPPMTAPRAAQMGDPRTSPNVKAAGVIGGLGDLWNVGKSVRKGIGTGLSYLTGKPLTATSFTAGAGGDVIGEEAYDALGWGPKAPVDPKAPVKPRGLNKLWRSDHSSLENLEGLWRRGFHGLAAGSVGSKRFIPAVRAHARQGRRNVLAAMDPAEAAKLPQTPGSSEYVDALTELSKTKIKAMLAAEIPRLGMGVSNIVDSHARATENVAKGTEKVPDVMSNIDQFTRWTDLPKDDPRRQAGGLQKAIETVSDAAKAQGQAAENITKPITDRFDLAFPSLKPPVEGAAPGTAPVTGTPQEPSTIERALTAAETTADSLKRLTGGQGSAGGGDGKPTGDGSTGDSNASTVKILTDSATSIGDFMNTANKLLPWIAGGTIGVGGLYALYKVFEGRRRDREEKERRALLHAMPLGYKAAAEKQAILVAPWEDTELTPYQYGFAVRVHEANLSPQQIRDGIEKVAEYMGEEYAEELREGMEKIALPVPGLPALGRGALDMGSNLIRKKIPQWLGRGGAQATKEVAQEVAPSLSRRGFLSLGQAGGRQAAQNVAPKVTQQAAKQVAPKMKDVGTSLADLPTSLAANRVAPQAAQQAAPVSGAFRAGQQFRRGVDATKAAPGQLWNATGGRLPWATTGRSVLGGATGAGMSGDDATMGERARNALLGAGMGFNLPTLRKHLPSVANSAMGTFYGSGAGHGLDELNRWRGVDSNYGQSLGYLGGTLGLLGNRAAGLVPQTVKNRIPAKAMRRLTGAGILATDAPEVAAFGRSAYDSATGGTGVPPTLAEGNAASPDEDWKGYPYRLPGDTTGLPENTGELGEATTTGEAPVVAPEVAPSPPMTVGRAEEMGDPRTSPKSVVPEKKPGFMDMLSGLGDDPRVASFGKTIDPILNMIGEASGQGPDFADSINPLMKILMMAGGGLGIGGLLGGGKKMGLGGLGMMAIPLIYQMMQGKKDEGAAGGTAVAGGTADDTGAGGQAPTDQPVQQITAQEQARQAAVQQTIGDIATNPKTKGIVASFGTTEGESGKPGVFDSPEDVSALVKSHALSGSPSAQEINTLISNLSPAGKASLADQIQSKWDELGVTRQNLAIATTGPKIPKLIAALREGTSYN